MAWELIRMGVASRKANIRKRHEREFAWIVTHDHPDDFETPGEDYYASPDRKAMRPDPAPLIEEAETYIMTSAIETRS